MEWVRRSNDAPQFGVVADLYVVWQYLDVQLEGWA